MPKKRYDVEQVLEDRVKRIAKIRKADAAARAAKKKRGTWVSRLKGRVQRVMKGRHSPAGKKYLAKKRGY
jgi:hypothetical protein